MTTILDENLENTKEKFDSILQKVSLKEYLKADPQQAGEKSELTHAMTYDFFLKNFCWTDNSIDKLIEDYRYKIEHENKKNVVLHGYEGCGKTTFINYWMNKENNRHVVLEFDKYIRNGDELLATIVGNIFSDLNKDVYENQAIIMRKICEIFTTEVNLRSMAENDIKNNFIYMFDKFKYVIQLVDKNDRKEIDHYMLYDIKNFMTENYHISELMLFMLIWDICNKRINNLSKTCYFVFENLDTLYESIGLQNLVTEIGVFRNNAETLFAEIKEGNNLICNPTKEYICIFVMRDTTKAVFNEHMNSQKVSLYIPKKSMTFNCRIDNVIRKKAQYLEKLRDDYPERFNENCERLLKGIHRIEKILNDDYVTDTMFTLFNNNFRKEFEILADINVDKDDIYNTYINLCNIGNKYKWPRYASRCILFRNIFNLLNEEGFFTTLKRTDYGKDKGNKRYAINLSRLILLYLQNSYNKVTEQKSREWEFISIEILARDMLKICDDENEIVKALWEMYEFRKRNNWNHLITFDLLHHVSKESILKQIQAVKTGQYEEIEFGKIRITLAGETYIEKVLTHFEYFVARTNITSMPSLFIWKIADILNLSTLNNYLEIGKSEITGCCKRLMCFNEEVLSNISDYVSENFLKSKFAHRKYYEDGSFRAMYHCERIVHSQITYLDAFRMYVFYRIDNTLLRDLHRINITKLVEIREKQSAFFQQQCKIQGEKSYIIISDGNITGIRCISKKDGQYETIEFCDNEIRKYLKTAMNIKVIKDIESYIMMFGIKNIEQRCTAISEDTKFLVNCYEACISSIKGCNYEKFDLEIDQTNGRKILGDVF